MGRFVRVVGYILLLGSALGPNVLALSISEAKLLPDDSPVSVTAKAVTYAAADFFYIEEDSRCTGIRVEKAAHGLAAGMRADVSGTMKTGTSRERYILASSAVHNGDGVVAPVGMNNPALGGTDWHVVGTGGQRGATGSLGLNNTGLLVRTWGRFQQVNATTFTVDDGSGLNVRCTVAPGTFLYSGWQYVCVVGASSLYKFNASIYPPLVLVRDIEVLLPAYPCEMIYIPAGSFLMGNNGAEPYSYCQELPQHSVYLPGYWIGKYEVTRGEYQQFMSAGGYSNPAYWSSAGWSWKVSSGRTQPSYWAPVQDWGMGAFTQTDSHPVVGVSYYECEAFCNWAGGHLATEAQWEKAARWTGSYPNVYPWGNTWDPEKCNNYYDHNAAGGGYQKYQTAPVGSYPSGVSPYGLHDMAGNVWEWVQDWYVSYPGSPCPFNYTGSSRVLRGGGWSSYVARYARCAYRLDNYPDYYWNDGGFRLAR